MPQGMSGGGGVQALTCFQLGWIRPVREANDVGEQHRINIVSLSHKAQHSRRRHVPYKPRAPHSMCGAHFCLLQRRV